MFERFTDEARQVVVYAQEEARMLQHPVIGSEHLLLGVLAANSTASEVLGKAGVDLQSARRATAELRPASAQRDLRGHIPFTPHAKRALESALRAAGDAAIDPAALLVGSIADDDFTSVHVLRVLGVDAGSIRAAARAAIGGGTASGARAVPAKRRRARGEADVAAVVERVVADRDRLRRALQHYGRHESGCVGPRHCTCGLQAELDL